VVLSHPTQYYSPWFQWLKANTSLQFRVFYLWDFGVTEQVDPKFGTAIKWDVDLLSGYECEFVANVSRNPGAESFFGFKNPALSRRLREYDPSALLLFGYKWASHLRVITWARMHGIPILFRGDSNLLGRPSQSPMVAAALRLLFSQMASFLYVGSANKEYFERFGVSSRKLFFSPHSVNNALFNRNEASMAKAKEVRRQLGIGISARVLVFAGKLIPAKQPMALLRAFLELRMNSTALVFVGEGSEKDELASEAAKGSSTNVSVHFLPFSNQSEMPARYLLGDVFVLPSDGIWETWGLAVNEAMHMGVPCIVSDRVGCQRDLVLDGETGWVFEANKPGALRSAVSRALSDLGSEERTARIHEAVSRRISGYTYLKSADGLMEALSALGA
jgi:glycosyltransferase involved in cell wall biosynthesis